MSSRSLPHIRHAVESASAVVAPSWPLSSVIAVNPLAGMEDRRFGDAVLAAEATFGGRAVLGLDEFRRLAAQGRIPDAVLADAARRSGVELSEMLAAADADARPVRRLRTLSEELAPELAREIDLVASEHCLHDGVDTDIEDPLGDLARALDRLEIAPEHDARYLEAHLAAQPGWASHLRWKVDHGDPDALARLLALRVAAEAARPALWGRGVTWRPGTPTDEEARRVRVRLAWQSALERAVQDPLLAALATDAGGDDGDGAVEVDPAAVRAQVVCCIDVRSEPLRREIEATPGMETFGYAGFFGLFAHVQPAGGAPGTDQCPVLVAPQHHLAEVEAPDAVARRRAVGGADDAWKAAKVDPVAPLALAEGAGLLAGPWAAARTLLPGLTGRLLDRLTRPRHRPPAVDRGALPIDAQADVVAALVGLGVGTAPLVVLCGHRSSTDNNPFESGLACGACGGHGGGVNARIVADMANDPEVRAVLADRGTELSDGTWFVAAEHETCRDQVDLTVPEGLPDSHRPLLAEVEAVLRAAGQRTAAARMARLPAGRRDRARGRDWAEPLPEAGLAGNIAMVIGPRSLTAPHDLGGRVFLHSYDAERDPDGSVLGGILTAPLVVGQWINAQYNLSTADPEVFGAGSKVVHNVVGDIGVLSGPGGDLRRGLPLQSVRAGDRLLHEPVRLMAVVQGRRADVDAAIAASPTLARLVDNEWISLVVRRGPGDPWAQRTRAGWMPRSAVVAPSRGPAVEVAA